MPSTVITSAVLTGPLAAQPAPNPFTPGTPALPEHCEVVGRLNDRLGANGQRYAINFRLRLPTAWNGRFFFQGGGGTNGVDRQCPRRAAGPATYRRARPWLRSRLARLRS